ncbi:MAG: gamma-glutamylcyclotransferase [Neomegalonema sp.]|nr:gamma-glutamylcyclotransferase [Neomegalonema sp.]
MCGIIPVMSENSRTDAASGAASSLSDAEQERKPDFTALLDEKPGRGLPDAEALDPDGGFWVFGYGSLLWRPGVTYDARREVALDGYERAFCLWSVRYRGTPESPGLVLGVRPRQGVSTRGAAFHVPAEHAAEGRAHLLEREMITGAYHERRKSVRCLDAAGRDTGETLTAITYLMNVESPQYTGIMSLERQAEIIAHSVGKRGANSDYLFNTTEHFREAGLVGEDVDHLYELEELVRRRQRGEG